MKRIFVLFAFGSGCLLGVIGASCFVGGANVVHGDRPPPAPALTSVPDTKRTAAYQRMKAYLDQIPAIDCHDHLYFTHLSGLRELLGESYLAQLGRRGYNRPFDTWWNELQTELNRRRALSFYRYQLPAFRDLYGVDFDRLTLEGARKLDAAIRAKYDEDPNWTNHVITQRANIELMLIDPDWKPYDYVSPFPYGVFIARINPLIRGFHKDEYPNPIESPYAYAEQHGLKMDSLDDYLVVLDRLIENAVSVGAVGIKSSLAYHRTLHFEDVPQSRAAEAFGKRREELTPEQIKAFEDFVFWRLCHLCAKYELVFQIHTGGGRIETSSPMNLINLIRGNPDTRFALFHGGFPWIRQTGVIGQSFPSNVWIDSCWLPTVSYSMAKSAYHEWLELMPSDRIVWGADCKHAEGIYGATVFTRECLAEVLAKKIDRGELTEEHAQIIGQQIMRDNALEMAPRLKRFLRKAP